MRPGIRLRLPDGKEKDRAKQRMVQAAREVAKRNTSTNINNLDHAIKEVDALDVIDPWLLLEDIKLHLIEKGTINTADANYVIESIAQAEAKR